MKSSLLILFSLILAGVLVQALPTHQPTQEKVKCKPGEIVPAGDGCNSCRCNEHGDPHQCTLMLCRHDKGELVTSFKKKKSCEPGSTVPAGDGCNHCTCGPDGKPGVCTLIGCGEVLPLPAGAAK